MYSLWLAISTNRSTTISYHTATIESLALPFEQVKEMQADGLEWGESYFLLGYQALSRIIQGRIGRRLACLASRNYSVAGWTVRRRQGVAAFCVSSRLCRSDRHEVYRGPYAGGRLRSMTKISIDDLRASGSRSFSICSSFSGVSGCGKPSGCFGRFLRGTFPNQRTI